MIQIDMDMPRTCYYCQFRSCKGCDEYYCDVTLEDVDITSEERSKDCPLKEQEPKKGKWLAIRTKDDTHEMTCSCCGYVDVELINRRITAETALKHLKDRIDNNKFCPNCGAKMAESGE